MYYTAGNYCQLVVMTIPRMRLKIISEEGNIVLFPTQIQYINRMAEFETKKFT
jgi:hypothetical protein